VSTKTIQELQKLVADGNRSEEERRQAAEHILKLKESDGESKAPEPIVDPALVERRALFSGAQRRLAEGLSRGQRNLNLIDDGRSSVAKIADKLAMAQIIRLMLDVDGSDGILYAVTGWNSESKKTLAERMGDHASNHECNAQWRLGCSPRISKERMPNDKLNF
jgi:hypothetical protein